MFSDLERSQSWQVQQQHQQQHSYASEQRQSQSQSGWFPLQDSSHHPQQQVLMRTSADDVYATEAEDPLLGQTQQQQQDTDRWVQQQQPASDPYVHDVGRLIPSRPDPAVYPSSQQPQVYSQEIGMAPGGGYTAWPHDSRLAGVPVPNTIEGQFEDQFLNRPQHANPHVVGGVHAGMAMMVSVSRQQPTPLYHHHEGVHNPHPYPHPHPRRRAKEISIGRWNADEHKWFLKGLEMFQGPAWGEIARLIGTRTSTQVRTHAQKFFTKLARMNQTLPYFDAQIQKERARLLAQGTSVTPTATSGGAFNYALSNLSPRKRVSGANNSPSSSATHMALKRGEYDTGGGFVNSSMSSQYGAAPVAISEYQTQTQTRMPGGYDDQVTVGDKMRGGGVGGGGAATYYHGPEDSGANEMYKPKFDHSGGMSPLLRKPRMYTDTAGLPVPSSSSSSSSLAIAADPAGEHSDPVYAALPHQQQQQQQHTVYAGLPAHAKDDFDALRQHYSAVDASQQQHQISHQHHPYAYSREPDMGYGMLHASSSVTDPVTTVSTATATTATAYPWDNDDASQQQQRQWLAVPPSSSSSSSSHLESSSSNSMNSSSGGGSLDAESLPSMNKLLFRGNTLA